MCVWLRGTDSACCAGNVRSRQAFDRSRRAHLLVLHFEAIVVVCLALCLNLTQLQATLRGVKSLRRRSVRANRRHGHDRARTGNIW
jgi:hypothetical protein